MIHITEYQQYHQFKTGEYTNTAKLELSITKDVPIIYEEIFDSIKSKILREYPEFIVKNDNEFVLDNLSTKDADDICKNIHKIANDFSKQYLFENIEKIVNNSMYIIKHEIIDDKLLIYIPRNFGRKKFKRKFVENFLKLCEPTNRSICYCETICFGNNHQKWHFILKELINIW